MLYGWPIVLAVIQMDACLLISNKFSITPRSLELLSLPYTFPKAPTPLSFPHGSMGYPILENGLWWQFPTGRFDFPNYGTVTSKQRTKEENQLEGHLN